MSDADRIADFASKLTEAFRDECGIRTAADLSGVSPGLIRRICRELGLPVHSIDYAINPERDRDIGALFLDGMNMEQIGARYGITRERVRQILLARLGLVGKDGGARKVARERSAAQATAREAAFFAKYGLNKDQYKAAGSEAARAFINARRNATGVLGAEFKMNFAEWWDMWQGSGLWDRRGRKGGCWLRRHDRSRPYEIGNVYISRGAGAPIYDTAVQVPA